MKLTLKLISPFIFIDLPKAVNFTKMKISKFKYRIIDHNNHALFIDVNDLNNENNYMDGIISFAYTMSIMTSDIVNSVIYYVNTDNKQWDFITTDMNILFIKLNIKNETGNFETSITPNNPLFLELEFQ